MSVNKVEINGETVLDLTGDSVTPEQLAQGTTAHNAAGEQITGTYTAEVFYIDLEGNYPNYTCPVAMADIEAAYAAGKVLECRCAMGQYIVTLPLFLPMQGFATWIFSGAGALKAAPLDFDAQSLTIAVTSAGVLASNTRLATMEDKLPNPNALTIKIGSTTVGYNGDNSETVEIADGSLLPAVTAADNGKFLRVVNGVWAAATVDNANGVSF